MGSLRKGNNILWIIVILFIVILGVTHCKAQSNISFSVYQDLKLATLGDSRGNDAFTTDITAKIHLNGFQIFTESKFIGYVSLGPTLEYAQLIGGDYTRFGVELGYTFTGGGAVTLQPIFNWGWIYRKTDLLGGDRFSINGFELGLNFGIKLSDTLRFKMLSTITQRKDLDLMWGSTNYVSSFAVGLEIAFAKPTY